jgi:ribose transport system substrate-binding protein
MTRILNRMAALTAVVGITTVLAACGDESSSNDTAAAPAAATETSSTPAASGGEKITLPTGTLTCGATDDSDDPCDVKVAPEGDNVRIGFFGIANNTYTTSLMEQGEKTASELGAEFKSVNNNFDPQEQARQLQDAIAADQFDAYIIEPISAPALKPLLEQLKQKGIPFGASTLTMGEDVGSAKVQYPGMAVQVSRTLASQGSDLAIATKEACGDLDPCNVGVIEGVANFPYDKQQEEPFKAELAKYPALKIADITYGGYTNATGRKTAQDLLTAHPDINVIASFGDNQSLGIEQAIKAAGKTTDEIKITSVGGTSDAVKAIKDGRWFASTVALPYNEMVVAVNAIVAAARGEDISIGISDMVALGDSFPHVLTQDNQAEWADFEGQWNSGG